MSTGMYSDVFIETRQCFLSVFKPGNFGCNDFDSSQHKGETGSVFSQQVGAN